MMTNNVTQNQQIIAQTAAESGVPPYIMLDTAQLESQFNANAVTMDTNGAYSVGLFQLNQQGQGAGYTISELQNPTTNASIAAGAMYPYVQRGEAAGLSGLPLLEYVDNNAGWPGQLGVQATQTVESSYDQKLSSIYNGGSTTGTSGSATGQAASATGIVGFIDSLHSWENPQPTTATGSLIQKAVGSVLPTPTDINLIWHRGVIVGVGVVILFLGIGSFAFGGKNKIIPIPV